MTVDQIEGKIIALAEMVYGVPVNGGDPLVDSLGLDSLEYAELALELEGIWPEIEDRIPLDGDVLRKGTVFEVAQTIHGLLGNRA